MVKVFLKKVFFAIFKILILLAIMALPAFCAKITLITGGGCGCGG